MMTAHYSPAQFGPISHDSVSNFILSNLRYGCVVKIGYNVYICSYLLRITIYIYIYIILLYTGLSRSPVLVRD